MMEVPTGRKFMILKVSRQGQVGFCTYFGVSQVGPHRLVSQLPMSKVGPHRRDVAIAHPDVKKFSSTWYSTR